MTRNHHFMQQRTTSTRTGTLIVLPFLLLLSPGTDGYAGGAPDMACLSMLPTGHGVGPQTSPAPYSIHVSKKSYKPGETLQVVVQSHGDDYFRGIFMQARMIGCNVTDTRTVGVFTNTDSELETKHCFGDVHSAVSHNSARKKRLKTFYWTAPVISSGHVIMRATMVRALQEYWTEVDSHLVADLHATIAPRCYNTPPPTRPPASAIDDQDGQGQGISTDHRLSHGPWSAVLHTSRGTYPIPKSSTGSTSRSEDNNPPELDESLPSWIGPSFDQKEPEMDDSAWEGAASWLIPAYQRADSSASGLQHWIHGALVVPAWLATWMLYFVSL